MEGIDVTTTPDPQPILAETVPASIDGTAPTEPNVAVEVNEVPAIDPNLEKYDVLLKEVKASPSEFNTWTSLISVADKLGDIEKIRSVYDAFLAEYPLCFGYWKKYAEAENKLTGSDAAIQVYERGVASIPYSVDLWGHYATFKKGIPNTSGEEIQNVLERGAAYVGTDYNAHVLWDNYVQFAQDGEDSHLLAHIYSRILQCPLKELEKYHQSFHALADSKIVSELVTMEEIVGIRAQLEAEKQELMKLEKERKAQAALTKAIKVEAAQPSDVEVKSLTDDISDMDATKGDSLEDEAGKVNEKDAVEGQDPMLLDNLQPSEAEDGAKPEEEEVAKEIGTKIEFAQQNSDGNPPDKEPMDTDMLEQQPADQQTKDEKEEEGGVREPSLEAILVDNPSAPIASAVGDTVEVKTEAEADTTVQPNLISAELTDEMTTSANVSVKEEGHQAMESSEDDILVVTDDEVKAYWVSLRDGVYHQAKLQLQKRKPFEDAIKRPYFHVKPLDARQLSNWNKYLDFIEAIGDPAAIVTLYERCLIACASYPELWERYVRYLEVTNRENAIGALQRATLVYCKNRPEIHLFSARFEERNGSPAAARAVYRFLLTELAPRLLTAIAAAANFERRQGDREAACSYYEELINEERSKEGSKIYPFLCIQYARFLLIHYSDREKGSAVMESALEQCPTTKAVWEAAISFEELAGGEDMVSRVLSLYNRCTAPSTEAGHIVLSEKDREELSLRSLDFADMYADPVTMAAVEALHAVRFPLPASVVESRKRSQESALGSGLADATNHVAAGNGPPEKVAKVEQAGASVSPAPAGGATVPSAVPYYPTAATAAGAAAAPSYPYSYYGQYGAYPYGTYGYS